MIKKLLILTLALVFLVLIPVGASAESESANPNEYVWILTETTVYARKDETESHNNINSKMFFLKTDIKENSYELNLSYIGEGNEDIGLYDGDSVTIKTDIPRPPEYFRGGEDVVLDASSVSSGSRAGDGSFLSVTAFAFFDRPAGTPHAPTAKSSDFVSETTESQDGKKAEITLTGDYPSGHTDGQKIVLCAGISSIITFGVRYEYEWLPIGILRDPSLDIPRYKAVITEPEGKVFYTEAGSTKEHPGSDTEIFEDEKLSTGAGSKAKLELDGGTYFVLSASTELALESMQKSMTRIRLDAGKLWARSIKPGDLNTFMLELEHGVLTSYGCVFGAEAAADASSVWVFTGTARFISSATGEQVYLNAGEKATFDSHGVLKKEEFRVTQTIGDWGIPTTVISETGGYGWVKIFIYVLIFLTAAIFLWFIVSRIAKKRRIKKRICAEATATGQCAYCGRILEHDEIFCKNCGAASKIKAPFETDEPPNT